MEEPKLINGLDFQVQIEDDVRDFVRNMRVLKRLSNEMTYAEWFDTFRAWCEVGTDMEMEFYGPRKDK
jgi:hypothetical protein